MFVGVSNHVIDAGEGRQFCRRSLRIAAGNDYPRVGVATTQTANGGARILFGSSRYTTGIQHDKVCILRGISRFYAVLLELSLYSSPVSLSGTTAEIFYVKTGHRTILAYAHLWMRRLRQL